MRAFISIELPREIINEVKKIQELIKKQNIFTGKFTESENLHLTLKFLGEIEDDKIEKVKKRLEGIKLGKEIFVELGDVGIFSKSFVRIIWVKLVGKGVFQLQKEIDKSLSGLFEKEERFMSHITIARVKKVSDKKKLFGYLKSFKPRKVTFGVNKFYLKKSDLFLEGPVYTDIKEYNLDKET